MIARVLTGWQLYNGKNVPTLCINAETEGWAVSGSTDVTALSNLPPNPNTDEIRIEADEATIDQIGEHRDHFVLWQE